MGICGRHATCGMRPSAGCACKALSQQSRPTTSAQLHRSGSITRRYRRLGLSPRKHEHKQDKAEGKTPQILVPVRRKDQEEAFVFDQCCEARDTKGRQKAASRLPEIGFASVILTA